MYVSILKQYIQLDRSIYIGALKATQNRGLQPAMDHLIENEGKPIPTNPSADTGATNSAMNVDEDEDEEALRNALNLSKGIDQSKGVEAEAKVIVLLGW